MSMQERRRVQRMPIQDVFSVFLVIPDKQGMSKIYLKDLSKIGLCFRRDTEIQFEKGQHLNLRLYTSPTFYLPISCKIVRVDEVEIGVEFTELNSKAMNAIIKLIDFLASAQEAIQQSK